MRALTLTPPAAVTGLAALVLASVPGSAVAGPPVAGLLPDLQTVVPTHLQLVNAQQREILRFSNGIANTGAGPWQMRPLFPPTNLEPQRAVQEVLNAAGQVVTTKEVSSFEFHPEHSHWHIDGVALFEVRKGSPNGPVWGGNSVKSTFCLIDWYALEGNSKTPDRNYFACDGERQGISPGWVDQYHQSTEGQQLDITGAPEGRYYLVSTANPDRVFLESTTANNTAWVAFDLTRPNNGNPKIAVVGNSPCASPGLCGVGAPNR